MIDESWYRRPPAISERVSAGGVVIRDEEGKLYVALVHEAGLPACVLPKGGVEPGETLDGAARREIEEEAGLTELCFLGKLGVCERLTFEKKYWAVTHYFLFCTREQGGTPTDPEHADGLEWHPLEELPEMFWPEQRALIASKRETILEYFKDL